MSLVRAASLTLAITAAAALHAQSNQTQQPPPPGHDISHVQPVSPGEAISTPLPEAQRRQLKKYDLPELAGAKQAIGSQLIDGRLPRPLVDFVIVDGTLTQRLSIFEGGLVSVRMSGAGGEIRKKLIIPKDALQSYLRSVSPLALGAVDHRGVMPPDLARRAVVRAYDDQEKYVERTYHPSAVLPKQLSDVVMPLQDLLRAISEDRSVTSTVANYEPKTGDRLIGDDGRTYEIVRVVDTNGLVELECLDAPTRMYVSKSELHNYFIGAAKEQKDQRARNEE